MMSSLVPRLLLIDEGGDDRQRILQLLEGSVEMEQADSTSQAREFLSRSEFHCVLLSYQIPDTRCELFLAELSERGLPTIVLTRQGLTSQAVASMKAGAYDYLVKETLDGACLRRAIAKALEKYALETGLKRKQAELEASNQALRASESQFRVLVENMHECFWMASADRRVFHYIGPQARSLLGIEAETLRQRPGGWLRNVHPADRAGVERAWRGDQDPYEIQYRVRGSQGQTRWVRECSSVVVNADGDESMVVGTLEDISRRRDLEEQLFQSQKMEALGRLAGSVAHDFNNLLTCIIGYSDLVLDELAPGSVESEDLRRIRSAGLRGESLVRQLLSFSRQEPVESLSCDLRSCLLELEHLLRRLLGEPIRLELTYPEGPVWVALDRTRAEQIILNLSVNARDAMPSGGVVHLRLEVRCETAILEVEDSGVGMEGAVQSRIFEPFFTSGKKDGTGLGLSTVYGIVSQASGQVQVESSPGLGSLFRVSLPLVAEVDREEGAFGSPFPCHGLESEPQEQTQGILVVEDQDDVRELISRVLRKGGYSVLSASHGREGLSVFQNQREQVDLVITDLVMPEMNGVEMFAQMESSTPILFVSGYSPENSRQDFPFPDGTLIKPFTSARLLNEVKTRLQAGG